jgi:hypothetical protein
MVDRNTFISVVCKQWGRNINIGIAKSHFSAFVAMYSHRESADGKTGVNGTNGRDKIDSRGYCLALCSLLPSVDESTKLKFAFETVSGRQPPGRHFILRPLQRLPH